MDLIFTIMVSGAQLVYNTYRIYFFYTEFLLSWEKRSHTVLVIWTENISKKKQNKRIRDIFKCQGFKVLRDWAIILMPIVNRTISWKWQMIIYR